VGNCCGENIFEFSGCRRPVDKAARRAVLKGYKSLPTETLNFPGCSMLDGFSGQGAPEPGSSNVFSTTIAHPLAGFI